MHQSTIKKLMNRLANGWSRDSHPDPAVQPTELPIASDNREKIGWISPVYTVSRRVRLDPNHILGNRCVASLPNAPEVEYYRFLRTRIIQESLEKGGNTVMITSALPGEGKTLTAINLSLTFAKEFSQTALLVDCDLKRQNVCEILGFDSTLGLVDHLHYDTPLSDLIVWPGIEKLTIISGGKTVTNSSELLGSQRMRDVLSDMKNRYPDRFVFLDVPPVLSGPDAMCLAPLVDHILVVVQAGKTPMHEVRKTLQLLPQEKIIGLVLNRQTLEVKPYRT